MQLTKRIKIEEERILPEAERPHLQFDDPPSPSPGRWFGSAFDLDKANSFLHSCLGNKSSYFKIGGVYSGGKTGEYVSFIWFAIGLIGSGVLSAMGKDIWEALKGAYKKTMASNGGQRNVVEVAFEFEDLDIVFHYESRDNSKILDMFDDADSVIEEVKQSILINKDLFGKVKTLELRRQNDGSYICLLFSYRKCRKMIETKTKK